MSDLVAQGASLLWTLCTSIALVFVNIPIALVLCIAKLFPAIQQPTAVSGTVAFYEGVVAHERKQPVPHAFRCRQAPCALGRPSGHVICL